MPYSTSNANNGLDLADSLLAPVANSGRRTMIPTLVVQHHMAELATHVSKYAEVIGDAMKGTLGAQTDYPLALKKVILDYALNTYYPQLQAKSPLISSPGNVTGMLDSKEPMATIEAGEDFAFFKAVHYPQLAKIRQDIKELSDSINLVRGIRFIPSFSAKDMLRDIQKLVGRRGLKADGKTRVEYLGGSEMNDEQMSVINDILARAEAELEKAARQNSNMHLWELIVLVDRIANENADIPMLVHPGVHTMMAQAAFVVLPVETSASMLLVRQATSDEYADEPEAQAGWQSTAEIDGMLSLDAASRAEPMKIMVVDMLLSMLVRKMSDVDITLNDLTLPLAAHRISDLVKDFFVNGQDLFLPKIESEFLDEWLKLAEMGAKTPLKTDDLRIRLDNALLRDRNNIPRKFIEALEENITKHIGDMIQKHSERLAVYRPYLQAPAERTVFRATTTVDDVRRSGAVRIETDQPFFHHERLTVAKPAGSDEAYVMANKIDNDTIIDGAPAASAAGLVHDLFKHKQPTAFNVSKQFDYRTAMDTMLKDHQNGVIPEIMTNDRTRLLLSELVSGGVYEYRDDTRLFEERGYNLPMAMPRSYVRLDNVVTVHEYPASAVSFGVVSGQMAVGLHVRWAHAIYDIATRMNRVYSTQIVGNVVQEPSIVQDYRSKNYLERKVAFLQYFTPIDVMDNPRVMRFLTSLHTQKMARERLDLDIMDRLQKTDLFINNALMQDIRSYSSAIAMSIEANFSPESPGMQIFRDFVSGDLSERDLMRLREPAVVAVFNTLMQMIFDRLEKKDTILTLVIIEELMSEMGNNNG